jgi:hypothetical protein
MTVKCSGADFLQFYNDPDWWFSEEKNTASVEEQTYWEDAQIMINGVDAPEYEFDFDKDIKPTDKISVTGGVVFGKVQGRKEPSMEGYLKQWLLSQKQTTITVICPKDKLDEIIAAIKAAGGTISK